MINVYTLNIPNKPRLINTVYDDHSLYFLRLVISHLWYQYRDITFWYRTKAKIMLLSHPYCQHSHLRTQTQFKWIEASVFWPLVLEFLVSEGILQPVQLNLENGDLYLSFHKRTPQLLALLQSNTKADGTTNISVLQLKVSTGLPFMLNISHFFLPAKYHS